MQNFSLTHNDILESTQFWAENSKTNYSKFIQNLISSRPFGDRPFYIFSFVKHDEKRPNVKKMYHQPRLTIPEPMPNTHLIRVDPKDVGTCEVIWALPEEESINKPHLFKFGMMFQDEFVHECVNKFRTNPKSLMKTNHQDLSDNEIRQVYREVRQKALAKSQGQKHGEIKESSSKASPSTSA